MPGGNPNPSTIPHMTNRFRSITVAAALLVPALATAQSTTKAFGTSSRIFNVGILTGGDYEGFGIGASFEKGVYEFTPSLTLGLGAFAGFVKGDVGQSNGFEYNVTQIPVMAIGNVHLAIPSQPNLDVYGGLSLGIVRFSSSFDGAAPTGFDDASSSDLGLGIQVGARYAFTPKVTAFGQLGVNDIPLLYAGLSFNF